MAGCVLRDGILGPFHWGTAWKFAVVPFIAGEWLLECLPSPADWRLARLSAIPLLFIGDCWFFVVEGALKGLLCPGTLILSHPD